MKILKVIEKPVRLQGNIANALVNFSQHTVSLLAIVTDAVRDGKPVTGLAFNSIGRYAQSGIINDRMIPRLLAAAPESLMQEDGERLCPEKVLRCVLQNEKPGGHGDRAMAASAIELAVWDLNAKLGDEPAAALIARHHGLDHDIGRVHVYAAGGYYYPEGGVDKLTEEFSRYKDLGFNAFKMKVGGASLKDDLVRIEAALSVAGGNANMAVDANGRFGLDDALVYAEALAPYQLRWFEEIGDPLDFDLNRRIAEVYPGAIATGENLFSHQDAKNLALFGGMRPDLDIFQMDSGLSYGITEYARILAVMQSHGYDRAFAFPHGGQLMALHVVAGLGLGGCEVYPSVFQPLGGFGDGQRIENGIAAVPDAPGFGFETKSALAREFATLTR